MKKYMLFLVAMSLSLMLDAATKYSHYYTNLPCAVEEVQPIVFPDYTVSLADFGGVGDGMTDNTEAFAKALSHLKQQGGGHLLIPDGRWLTGPVKMVSNVDLHLADNATIYRTSVV